MWLEGDKNPLVLICSSGLCEWEVDDEFEDGSAIFKDGGELISEDGRGCCCCWFCVLIWGVDLFSFVDDSI